VLIIVPLPSRLPTPGAVSAFPAAKAGCRSQIATAVSSGLVGLLLIPSHLVMLDDCAAPLLHIVERGAMEVFRAAVAQM